MINQVYTTVLAIINKDNRGYISPIEFNLYAEMAQLSIFEDLFHKYSRGIVKQNARMYHSEFSDIPKHIREVLDIFTDECNLVASSSFWIPSASDFYRLIKLDYNQKELEEISKLDINRVLNNNLVAPTNEYPAYINLGGKYKLYPSASIVGNQVLATYIRKPRQPKWTYTTISGNPLFNPSALDYQDFELPYSLFTDIVIKVLGYAGVEIREADIIQLAQAVETSNTNNEQL
jgi:hypothetical protein